MAQIHRHEHDGCPKGCVVEYECECGTSTDARGYAVGCPADCAVPGASPYRECCEGNACTYGCGACFCECHQEEDEADEKGPFRLFIDGRCSGASFEQEKAATASARSLRTFKKQVRVLDSQGRCVLHIGRPTIKKR